MGISVEQEKLLKMIDALDITAVNLFLEDRQMGIGKIHHQGGWGRTLMDMIPDLYPTADRLHEAIMELAS